MHSSLTAGLLCIFAQAAAAQCVDTTLAGIARQPSETVTAPTMAAPAVARPGGELIKTAAAATRGAPPAPREAAQVARLAPSGQAEEDHQPRSGKAMLLAALALMSGIALRRYGANKR